jgi:hypothetical protein
VPTSARQIWLRQQSIRSLRYLPWKNLVRKQVVRPIREAANAITLKDYELARVPARPHHTCLSRRSRGSL